MNYMAITYPDINNGIGLRVTLWLSGCNHKCIGCHNPETWDPNSGMFFGKLAEERLDYILSLGYIKGLTLSGGDPLYCPNRDSIYNLLLQIKNKFPHKDIWLYTGYKWEDIMNDSKMKDIVSFCDTVVDGKFIKEKRCLAKFKGSTNQRVIDVKKSLLTNKIVKIN